MYRMSQLNIHLTEEFEKRLAQLMRLKGLKTKSEAIRLAVAEAVEREIQKSPTTDYRSWIGEALRAPVNPRPRFRNHDELWH